MNDLNTIIGDKVYVYFEDEEKVLCEVTSIDIDTYYFYDKNEPITICVGVVPLEEYPNTIASEDFNYVPLDYIRYAGE